MPGLAADVGGEDAREEPDLDQERHDVLDVAVGDVERREPEADPERGHEREQEQARHHQHGDRPRGEAVGGEHDDEDREGDREVDETREHGGDRRREPREVDLAQQVRVADEARRRLRHRAREERPGHEAGEVERQPGDPGLLRVRVEEERHHDHQEQRLEDGPGDPERGLLVADEDVPPGEEEEELAVAPELAEAEAGKALRRAEDLDGGLAHTRASTRGSPTRSPRMSSSE